MRQLAKFSISVREEDFVLHLVDDAGEATDFACAPSGIQRENNDCSPTASVAFNAGTPATPSSDGT